MKQAADTLYLLASFNIRAGMFFKALHYARAGVELFPDNADLCEMLAYAQLATGDPEGAEETLAPLDLHRRNVAYLKSRTAIFLDLPKNVRAERVRAYLSPSVA